MRFPGNGKRIRFLCYQGFLQGGRSVLIREQAVPGAVKGLYPRALFRCRRGRESLNRTAARRPPLPMDSAPCLVVGTPFIHLAVRQDPTRVRRSQ